MTTPNDIRRPPHKPRRRSSSRLHGGIHMHNLFCKRRLAAEAGFVLPSAIAVLLVLAMLTGAAIALSTRTSSSTTRDDNVKAALEAAEAGLQVASYRLTQLEPKEKECINGSGYETPSGKKVEATEIIYCKMSSEEPLGNKAYFQFQVSLPLETGANCAGTVGAIPTGYVVRCLTSEGMVSSVHQRLSMRVESKAGESLFTTKGIEGLKEVKISGSVKVPAVVSSNEKIIGEGSAAFDKGFELCPEKGTFKPAAGKERNASGVTVGGVGGMLANPPLEVTRASGCPLKAPYPSNHATAASNEDSRIGKEDEFFTEGKAANKFTGSPNYELTLASNARLTLGGSKYYFCNFHAERNSRLKIAPTAKVAIFIDSPEDKESKCPKGTGKFEGEGEFIVENEAKTPAALLIDVYGKGPFTFANGSSLEGSIYAPEAEVKINGGTKFKGGIVGSVVHIENGTGIFEWSEEAASWTNGVPTAYGRKAWQQCGPSSSPSEGC
jgi:hypothetical protein